MQLPNFSPGCQPTYASSAWRIVSCGPKLMWPKDMRKKLDKWCAQIHIFTHLLRSCFVQTMATETNFPSRFIMVPGSPTGHPLCDPMRQPRLESLFHHALEQRHAPCQGASVPCHRDQSKASLQPNDAFWRCLQRPMRQHQRHQQIQPL